MISANLSLHKAFKKYSIYRRVCLRFSESLLQQYLHIPHSQESLNSGSKQFIRSGTEPYNKTGFLPTGIVLQAGPGASWRSPRRGRRRLSWLSLTGEKYFLQNHLYNPVPGQRFHEGFGIVCPEIGVLHAVVQVEEDLLGQCFLFGDKVFQRQGIT